MIRAKNIKLWQLWVMGICVVFTLLVVNLAIADKEQHLANGKEVLLEMVPVDPRSIMQGDYMRVRFAIEDDIKKHLGESFESEYVIDGIAMLRLDERNIGRLEKVVIGGDVNGNKGDDSLLGVSFRIREGRVKFATSSFFFQEGKAKHYEQAKYGLFKVNDKGEPLLIDLVL